MKKQDKFSNNHKGGGEDLSAAVSIHKAQGVTTNFSSLQFASVRENNFPAAAVVSIHKCQLADQQVSIGSQVAVNDRIASFQYWSGVDCK